MFFVLNQNKDALYPLGNIDKLTFRNFDYVSYIELVKDGKEISLGEFSNSRRAFDVFYDIVSMCKNQQSGVYEIPEDIRR